jgi:hypothetical protein
MFDAGDKVFFRTVTYHLVGEIAQKEGDWIELKDASWVADSGRFHKALADGTLSEVEKVGIAFVNLNTVTDAFPWTHDLPVATK